jgi:3-methylcrotonyl-CoA carboxylase alpha subunit
VFQKILIANRGEIACRVAATARRLGVQTVAVYSEADAHAKHVAACDQAVAIGGNAPKDSYLRWDRIIEAAQATGAQAIHPGYGFLSENEAFAQACAAAGLVFIGPPPAAIQAMGLKAESKRLMEAAGVPLVPGYHGTDQNPEHLAQQAAAIGYPVLIKASAGGGGKGMRVVQRAQDFAAALASCQREARNSFGNDAVLVEKYVQRPRHIEIQVFADAHGNAVYLFERDCSVQRRHQKVLEEAPAPGMTPELRRAMGEVAVAAAKAVQYVGAGTVEFIVEQPDGYGLAPTADNAAGARFFFMEMNTRLQVEHPVTEAITGQDLVEWQLRVACGEPLPLKQEQLSFAGHAVEARICAENPDNGFLPVTGTLVAYRKPPHTAFERATPERGTLGVRVDDGVRQGDAISPYYDSMVAKLIVHGDTRAQALARLDAALAQLQVVGLPTNVHFLRQVVRSPSFAQARLDTALIEREADRLFNIRTVPLALGVAVQVAHGLLAQRATETANPFSRTDGWHSHGEVCRPLSFEVGPDPQPVTAQLRHPRQQPPHLSVDAAGGEPAVQGALVFAAEPDGRLRVAFGPWQVWAQVTVHDGACHLHLAQGGTVVRALDPLARVHGAAGVVGGLTAPMPGKVVSVAVAAGDAVTAGQPLAVMEAMKMEHTLSAPRDGTVQEVLVAPGDQVGDGAELIRLVPLAASAG